MKEFAKEVADKVLHHRLLALDIMLDEQGNPKLIEVNVGGFSAWLFQYTNGSAFGQYTDEVISFLMEKKWMLIKKYCIVFCYSYKKIKHCLYLKFNIWWYLRQERTYIQILQI